MTILLGYLIKIYFLLNQLLTTIKGMYYRSSPPLKCTIYYCFKQVTQNLRFLNVLYLL